MGLRAHAWLSDSFLGGGVEGVSLAAATIEVVSALALGAAGLYAGFRAPMRRTVSTQAKRILHPAPVAMAVGNVTILAATQLAW